MVTLSQAHHCSIKSNGELEIGSDLFGPIVIIRVPNWLHPNYVPDNINQDACKQKIHPYSENGSAKISGKKVKQNER